MKVAVEKFEMLISGNMHRNSFSFLSDKNRKKVLESYSLFKLFYNRKDLDQTMLASLLNLLYQRAHGIIHNSRHNKKVFDIYNMETTIDSLRKGLKL
jgi:hypothetical protein